MLATLSSRWLITDITCLLSSDLIVTNPSKRSIRTESKIVPSPAAGLRELTAPEKYRGRVISRLLDPLAWGEGRWPDTTCFPTVLVATTARWNPTRFLRSIRPTGERNGDRGLISPAVACTSCRFQEWRLDLQASASSGSLEMAISNSAMSRRYESNSFHRLHEPAFTLWWGRRNASAFSYVQVAKMRELVIG